MATLYFKVSSDWEQVVKLRDEIKKLENQLKSFGKSTPEQEIHKTEERLAATRQEFTRLTTEAAKAGAVMENDFKKKIYDASQSVNDLSSQITKQRGVIHQFQNELAVLKDKYRETVKSGGDTSGLSEQIKVASSRLREQKDALFSLTQEQANARLSVKKLRDEYALYRQEAGKTVELNNGLSVSLGKMLGVIGGVAALKNFATEVVTVRGEFQQLEIAFSTMLKSKEKADALMNELVDIAAHTPFDLQGVASSAKQMLAYGSQVENVGDELVMLGNVAAGVGSQLSEIAYLYGTLRTQGRAYATDIRQFAGRGIPIYEELAKVLGVTKDEVSDFVTEGKVGFKEVEQAFKNMTSESGIYYNLMQEQSKSLTGQISNLGDAWDTMLNEIGQSTQGIASAGISGLKDLIENYETIGKVLTGLIAVYGTYKAATIAVWTLEQARAKTLWTSISATKALAVAQAALNTVMKTNPYVLLATAVAGVVAAMWTFRDSASAAEKAQERFNQRLEEQSQLVDERKQKADQLLTAIKEETNTDYERNKALAALKQMYPQIFQQYDTEALKLADILKLKKQIAEIEESRSYQSNREYYGTLVGKRDRIDEEIDFRSKNYGSGQYRYGEFYGKTVDELRKEREATQKELDLMYSDLQKESNAKWESVTPKEVKVVSLEKNIEELESDKKQLEEAISGSQSDPYNFNDPSVYAAKLKAVNAQLEEQRKALGKLRQADTENTPSISKEIRDVTDKIRGLKQEITDLRSGKLQAETGKSIESAIEEKAKELQQAEKSLETLTGIKMGSPKQQKKPIIPSITVQDEEVSLITPEEIQKNIDLHREMMDKFLADYGTYQQKLEAIADMYALKIAQAETEGERLSLQKQMESALKELDFEEFKGSINFADIFGNLDEQTTDALRVLREKLVSYINQAASELRPEDLKELQDAFSKLDLEIAERDPWEEMKSALQEYRDALREVNEAKEESVNKTESQAKAEGKLQAAEQKRMKALSKLTTATNALGEQGIQVVNMGNQLVDMLSSFGVEVPEAVSGALDGLGQVMNGLANLDFSKPFSIITSAVSVFTGLGKTIGSLFGIGGADYSGYEEMRSQYEALLSVWDDLIAKKKEYINISYGAEAIKAAEEVQQMLDTELRTYRQLADQLLASGAGIGSHSLARRIEDRMTAEDWARVSGLVGTQLSGDAYDLFDLDPSVIGNVLNDEKTVSVLNEVNPELVEYIKNIASYEDGLKDITDALNESLTGVSFDEFQNSFVDMLSNLDATNEDFADNLEKYLQNAIFSSLVANQYKSRIQKLYNQWSDYAESDNSLTSDEAGEIRKEYNQIVNDMLADRNQIMETMGWQAESSSQQQQASSGGFQTMSQDSADELNGRFTALQMSGEEINNQAAVQTVAITEMKGSINALAASAEKSYSVADEVRSILAQSYLELQEIRENTGAIVAPIRQIQNDIAEVKQNTARI